MATLFAEFSPSYVYSQSGEKTEIENRLVLQIRNLSDSEAVILNNEPGTEWEGPFPTFDEVTPTAGRSFIYIKAPLGDENHCLTSLALFSQVQCATLDTFYCHYCAQGEGGKHLGDTIVLYPAETLKIEPLGQIEMVIGKLKVDLKPGGTVGVAVKYVNVELDRITKVVLPVYRLVHPLCIRKFELCTDCTVVGFRDDITLHWLILGADSATLTPGDFKVLPTAGKWSTRLTDSTSFMLIAKRGNAELAKNFSVDLSRAQIQTFTCSRSQQELTFTIEVKGTRHVFLSQCGRLEVPQSGKLVHTIPYDASQQLNAYTLIVESNDSTEQKTVSVPST